MECEHCQRSFEHRGHLNRHLKIVHGKPVEPKKNPLSKKCPICLINGTKKEILEHFVKVHEIPQKVSTLSFQNMSLFEEWKIQVENETNTKFVQERQSRKGAHGVHYTHYHCHRDGMYVKKGKNRRNIKVLGSNKINGFCPAEMAVSCFVEIVTVIFNETHVGHTMDLGRIALTEKERSEIAAKIAMKVPFNTILNTIRDSVSDNALRRIHLLTRKDLYNIERDKCLKREKCISDVASVESWIKQMKRESSLIRYYKAQGQLCPKYTFLEENDFVLIFSNDAQIDILRKYGDDCICIDGTDGMNAYNFQLITLLVLDDLRRGFPCAFFISNKTDSKAISILYNVLNEILGCPLKPKVFMSDMAEAFYNTWVHVMSPAAIQFQLYCPWHVDNAWRKNLTKIKNNEKKVFVYKNIRTLLEETDENAFLLMLEKTMTDLLSDPETNEFGELFKFYKNNCKSWAYCYGNQAGINTIMHLERMHRTIKYIYLNGKMVKRLDEAIAALMTFIRDKLFDRSIASDKEKVSTKIQLIRQRHQTSIEMKDVSITDDGEHWFILSSTGADIYCLKRAENNNCDCQLKCDLCSACIHKFKCSCSDNSIQWNMCKHIHYLCTKLKQQITDKEIENTNLIIDEINEENHFIVEQLNSPKETDFTNLKNETTNAILGLLDLINKNTTLEQLRTLKNMITPIPSVVKSLESQKQIIVANKTDQHSFKRNKIDNKGCLYQRKNKPGVTKPTKQEKNQIKYSLIIRANAQFEPIASTSTSKY